MTANEQTPASAPSARRQLNGLYTFFAIVLLIALVMFIVAAAGGILIPLHKGAATCAVSSVEGPQSNRSGDLFWIIRSSCGDFQVAQSFHEETYGLEPELVSQLSSGGRFRLKYHGILGWIVPRPFIDAATRAK